MGVTKPTMDQNMWDDTTRAQYARDKSRLPSSMSDEEWAVLEPLLPKRCRLGRPAKWPLRDWRASRIALRPRAATLRRSVDREDQVGRNISYSRMGAIFAQLWTDSD
jgi:hypothetical protein